ncbi:MAG: phosphotransferase family protein [Rhizobiales bacterium]|nr:phosphotransferase family protein [Hyphomicrobiales bacterium]MBI3673958.1 phosphotransferase family protein [Hyphomicrobiales bacterium]
MAESSENAESRVRGLACWRGLASVVPLKGGVSNASFTVTDATGKYVARVGEDYPFHQVSREREAVASRAAFEAGLSPEVVHVEPGIMVVRHLEARTYREADVRENSMGCVEIVRRCHRDLGQRIAGQGAIFWVFQILRDYGFTLKAGKHRHVPDLPRWMAIVNRLEAAQVPLPIVFGHHDLLPSNFMDDGKRLWLIDWEYGAFGTAMFDLANIASNNSFDEAGEVLLLEAYFGKKPPEATIRAFYAMKAASALREALWGMVSELHLKAPGVDYIAYAAEYLGRFDRVHADYLSKFGTS